VPLHLLLPGVLPPLEAPLLPRRPRRRRRRRRRRNQMRMYVPLIERY
jgi:hypothetical protein